MDITISTNTSKSAPLTAQTRTPIRQESTAPICSSVRLSDEIFISPEGRKAVEGAPKEWDFDELDTIIQENASTVWESLKALPKQELAVDPYGEVDPDRTIARRAYMDSLTEQVHQLKQTVRDYYAEAHAENARMSLQDALSHLAKKYLDRCAGSPEFRSDMSYDERQMAYYQERSLLTGRALKLIRMRSPVQIWVADPTYSRLNRKI